MPRPRRKSTISTPTKTQPETKTIFRITLTDDEDLDLLRRIIVAQKRRMDSQPGGYVEYLDPMQRIYDAVEAVERVSENGQPAPEPVVDQPKPRGRPKGSKNRQERTEYVPNLCSIHPKYGAVRRPRTECSGCWAAYERFHPTQMRRRHG